MHWILLSIGIAIEILATTSLKLSDGFTKLGFADFTLICFGLISLKNSDGQKNAFGFGKPFSKRGIIQTGFGFRGLSRIAFVPIGEIGLLTEFFNRISPYQNSPERRKGRVGVMLVFGHLSLVLCHSIRSRLPLQH